MVTFGVRQGTEVRRGTACVFIYFSSLNLTNMQSALENYYSVKYGLRARLLGVKFWPSTC